jgi:nicotinate phosphoribosyltransferase
MRMSALFTDLYELTMMQAYQAEGMYGRAVFELFFRRLPEKRNFILAAGLEDALDFLENLQFTADEIDWLRELGQFEPAFLEGLHDFRFAGDVWAMPEGSVVFENEPVLQVAAPIAQAQLVETFLLNQIHAQCVQASKAARVVLAAAGRPVVDFGSRRCHGADAALTVARNTYMAGGAGTSNVLASRRYAIPAVGTMAHSYIQAHGSERGAFRDFMRAFPQTTLLVDTYDTLTGVDKVVELARESGENFAIRAIRLDSGDLAQLAHESRRRLDAAGLDGVQIFASSSLDEYAIRDLLAAGAPIDGFGVGTRLAVSADAPDVDFAYKLVEYAGVPRMKLSAEKVILPGRKQVFRQREGEILAGDVLAGAHETLAGEPLLQPVMRAGRTLDSARTTLAAKQQHATAQLRALPESLRSLERSGHPYHVGVSAALQAAADGLRRELETAGSRR